MNINRYGRKVRGEKDPLDLDAKFHAMKRDGYCFGCSKEVLKGHWVYRINLLIGKQERIHFCPTCQGKIITDIRGMYEQSN